MKQRIVKYWKTGTNIHELGIDNGFKLIYNTVMTKAQRY